MILSKVIPSTVTHTGPKAPTRAAADAAKGAAAAAAGGLAKVHPEGATSAAAVSQSSFVARYRQPIVDGIKAAVLLGFYVLLGCLVYGQLEPDWTTIDAFYFAMMTMSTVGYGDISPTSDGSRVFTIFMILFGIIVVDN